jgi:hypothetical protein
MAPYEKFCSLGQDAAWSVERQQAFRRKISLLFSESTINASKKPARSSFSAYCFVQAGFLLRLFLKQKFEATFASEASVNFQQTTQSYVTMSVCYLNGMNICFRQT